MWSAHETSSVPTLLEAFRRELEGIGVTDVFFELFDGTHGGIVWRYPIALRFLAERLGAP